MQTAVGAGVLLLGLALALGAITIPSAAGYGGVGPNFLPWVVAVSLAVCGVMLIWAARSGGLKVAAHDLARPPRPLSNLNRSAR